MFGTNLSVNTGSSSMGHASIYAFAHGLISESMTLIFDVCACIYSCAKNRIFDNPAVRGFAFAYLTPADSFV